MTTKVLMTAAAVTLGIAGVLFTFVPDEILSYANRGNDTPLQILLQIFGALYFAFAMLNWMTRTSLIGGIYTRPVAVANFTHFFIGGLALTKGVIANTGTPLLVWVIAGIYLAFAISFTAVLFRHPKTSA